MIEDIILWLVNSILLSALSGELLVFHWLTGLQ